MLARSIPPSRRGLTALVLPLTFLTFLAVLPALAEESSLDDVRERMTALAANEEGLSESEKLARFDELFLEYVLIDSPELATMMGRPVGQDRWSDRSPEAIERRERDVIWALDVLRGFDRSKLEGKDRLNYDLLLETVEDQVQGQRFPGHLVPINQMNGVQQNVPNILSMMSPRRTSDFENVLARLAAVPKLVEQVQALLAKGLEAGVTPPRVTLRDVPEQVSNLLTDDPMQSALLRPFVEIPESIPEAEAQQLRERAVALYRDEVRPAYENLHRYLVDEYLPKTRQSIAMKDLPDGQAWYAFNVAQSTTTDLSPQEIHEIGLAEVARIRGEMDKVIAATGFEGTFEEFTEFLRTDEQFYFDDADQLLEAYRDIAKRADAELPRFFGHLPRLPYGVTPVPPYAEKSQTTAYYQPGSLEAGRAGQFFANTYKLETRPSWEMEALTLHEAVPGHHLQIALAQEIEDIPWYRRMGGYTAFVEGWGLYAESLGEEMGFYEDPYSKFGQLTYEMWRAIRLVVDTGMHSLGWTRQQAIDYFLENTGKTEHDIIVEVDRYIVWPGQALAYKIGELEIKRLRALAEKELGNDFDVRAFHDTVLGDGGVPLAVLATKIEEWIDEQKGGMQETSP